MAINKVVYGSQTLIDLTADTVTADQLAQGVTAHDKSGYDAEPWRSQRNHFHQSGQL